MTATRTELLTSLLKQVSRSFYTTLRVLPGAIREQISLAYLLARATDTVADTELVPAEQRLAALNRFQARIQDTSQAPLDFRAFLQHQGSAPERRLLENAETAAALLDGLSAEDLHRVRNVLEIITAGQALDLQRFAGASEQQIVALGTEAELDDYTYRVAGCVGEFWTHMCRAHLFPEAALDEQWLLNQGVRFGKGLQLVNILRDLPADLRNGRCYVPLALLAPAGLTPADLLLPANAHRFAPVYHILLDRCEAHLRAGWEYTNALPRSQMRVRLACAWPILIGLETLGRLRSANVLDASHRVKISRPAVRRIMVHTLLNYPLQTRWRRLAAKDFS